MILLFSGATPASHSRLDWLRHVLPLGVLEASHFLGSIVGVVLLLLARGLQRRLDSAYWLTLVLLAMGVAASLLKGFDYEEAIFLAVMLAALAPCRQHFYRKSSLVADRFSPHWTGAVLLVMVCAAARCFLLTRSTLSIATNCGGNLRFTPMPREHCGHWPALRGDFHHHGRSPPAGQAQAAGIAHIGRCESGHDGRPRLAACLCSARGAGR